MSETPAESRSVRLVSFRIAGDSFAIDIMTVRQIVPWSQPTAVPGAPGFIEGIILLRGEVIPIVDLRRRLDRPAAAVDRGGSVIIVATSRGVVGLRADEVRRIVDAGTGSFLPAPPLVQNVRGELLVGVLPWREELLLLLDVEAVLSPGDQMALRGALDAGQAS
jgi:purine-binding chemotaxis protein CheW